MDKEKMLKYGKIIIICLVLGLIIWFLIVSPLFTFKSNENKMLKAGKRYFEVNSNELPTGSRVKAISLKDLYSKSFLEDDFYVPLSHNACSVTESWVKVKRVDGEYKYYTYLKCGVLSSIVDHKGPEITLNGDDTITVNKDGKYRELGVKSVNDNSDGAIDVSKVEINSKSVDTSKVGTYEVTYTAYDSLNNKTEKVRKVKVVSRLKNTVNKETNNTGYYVGGNPNNYIYFSGMLFRIVGVSGDNVKIIADSDISNVNYSGIDKWLDYYYKHLTDKSKKYIVEDKYCNMKLNDETINTVECSSYTKKRKSYIISVDEVNRSLVDGSSYLKPNTLSWTSNTFDKDNSYVTRNVFYEGEYGKTVIAMPNEYNYGVRPVITVRGDTLITGGMGKFDDPYLIGDMKSGKANDSLNKRYTGEYIKYSGYMWRIIDVDSDGTTKVISEGTLKSDGIDVETRYNTDSEFKIYNPKEKGNVGYFIENKASEYLKTDYFVSKNVMVPIYKNYINYGKEVETKKYKVKLSAPNMYEMFSAYSVNTNDRCGTYWEINSSKTAERKAVVMDIGYQVNEELSDNYDYGLRVVGYLSKDVNIVSGSGTVNDPYVISK